MDSFACISLRRDGGVHYTHALFLEIVSRSNADMYDGSTCTKS